MLRCSRYDCLFLLKLPLVSVGASDVVQCLLPLSNVCKKYSHDSLHSNNMIMSATDIHLEADF